MIALSEMTGPAREAGPHEPMDLRGVRVLVVGLARTGVAVARFLSNRGATVVGTDTRDRGDLEREFPDLRDLNIELQVGGHGEEGFLHADLIVLSPGVPPFIEPLAKARQQEIPIISEIELASRFLAVPIVAVTGTNGKTTTTLLIGAMLQRAGKRVFVGGNVGNPLINSIVGEEKNDIAVVELSSFQLEGIEKFRPAIAVLLNITEDHLDRYPGFEAYIEAKSRVFMNQRPSDVSVLNAGDPMVERAASSCKARKVYFNVTHDQMEGAFLRGRQIVLRRPEGEEIYDPEKGKLMGPHNIENMMAAIVAARLCGCPEDGVQEALEAFNGLAHRLEFVKEVKGVRYFNDSKGTNVGAVVKSLQTFPGPLILIAGGKDKGGDYAPLKQPIEGRVKDLILIGQARERMARHLGDVVPITLAGSLEEAVKRAYALAQPGDSVLLSPACSSYDMFRDYVERGEVFKVLVRRLPDSNQNQNQ